MRLASAVVTRSVTWCGLPKAGSCSRRTCSATAAYSGVSHRSLPIDQDDLTRYGMPLLARLLTTFLPVPPAGIGRRGGSRYALRHMWQVRVWPIGRCAGVTGVTDGGRTMIEVENLSKRYGEKLAVDGLDFVVRPGIVTGFLGPNGAGKSTTMRMIAGLDEPSGGSVRVNGRAYRSAAAPMAELGV